MILCLSLLIFLTLMPDLTSDYDIFLKTIHFSYGIFQFRGRSPLSFADRSVLDPLPHRHRWIPISHQKWSRKTQIVFENFSLLLLLFIFTLAHLLLLRPQVWKQGFFASKDCAGRSWYSEVSLLVVNYCLVLWQRREEQIINNQLHAGL